MGASETGKLGLNWEHVKTEYQSILASGEALAGVERDVVHLFRELAGAGNFEDRIPMTGDCTVVYEFAMKFGRADIVVFHIDGSASVIEVKDGTNGYNHVVSGIGQAGLYAAQLGMAKSALKSVRKCLMWTSTGSLALDSLIETVCEDAGVVALPWQSMRSLMATRRAVTRVALLEPHDGCA